MNFYNSTIKITEKDLKRRLEKKTLLSKPGVAKKKKPSKKVVPKAKRIKRLEEKLVKLVELIARYKCGFKCVVCGRKYPYGETTRLHGGHWISRGHKSTKFLHYNIHAQCQWENFLQSQGNVEVISNYYEYLKTIKEDLPSKLSRLSHESFKLTEEQLEKEIELNEEILKWYKDWGSTVPTPIPERFLKASELKQTLERISEQLD
jgi:hypothetical protein